MYTGIVVKMMLLETGMIVAAILLFLLTYYLTRTSPLTRRYTWASFFGLGLAVLGVWIYRRDAVDAWNYLHLGDTYPQHTICRVHSVTGTTIERTFLGRKHVACTDGTAFHLWFDDKPLHPEEGKVYLIVFLPRSHEVLDIRSADDTGRLGPRVTERHP